VRKFACEGGKRYAAELESRGEKGEKRNRPFLSALEGKITFLKSKRGEACDKKRKIFLISPEGKRRRGARSEGRGEDFWLARLESHRT